MDNIREHTETFVLSVVNIQPADVGDYICNASDGVGQLVATLRIRGEVMHCINTDVILYYSD